MSNIVKKEVKFTDFISNSKVQDSCLKVLHSKEEVAKFTASIVSVVQANKSLMNCDHNSIINAALVGHALKLPPSPTLGYFYLVPYRNNYTGISSAQFQIGYKGYIQLALRTSQYKNINVLEVRKGELEGWDDFTENYISFKLKDNRENLEVQGYLARFELINGFSKTIYWSYNKMLNHANTYSKAFANKKKKDSFWHKNFDEMAKKTLIRQLISKWGIMSLEIEKAYTNDMAEIQSNGNTFIDNSASEIELTPEEEANQQKAIDEYGDEPVPEVNESVSTEINDGLVTKDAE